MRTPEQEKADRIRRLKVLQYAAAGTPMTIAGRRGDALRKARDLGLVEVIGERRRAVVARITPQGIVELDVLRTLYPDAPDYAANQAVRRAMG